MNTVFRSKSTFLSLAVVAGILGVWGVLSLSVGGQTGDYASTPPAAILPTEKAAITYSGASVLVWKSDTDSSLTNYQLERDACCTGAK